VEPFKVPEGYKSFATNSYIHHDSLVSGGTHKDKQESIKMAVKDLRVLMEEYEKNNN
jgi:hypothetical protein